MPQRPSESQPAATDPKVAFAVEWHRILFERSLAGVYVTTLDGEILECNEACAKMLGYECPEALLSRKAHDLYHSVADRAAFIERLKRDGVLVDSELSLRRSDGRAVHILENVNLLENANGERSLVLGTMVDITERKKAEEALRESEERYKALAEELRRLSHHQQMLRDDERARIARELHDELGQDLTAMNMEIHWLQGRSWHAAEQTQQRLAAMRDQLDKTMLAVRRICNDLRPTVLDDLGLIAAIEWQGQDFASRTGLTCDLDLPEDIPALPGATATCVFRILQESLTNVARHAKAAGVRIVLSVDSGVLNLQIADDGIGISEADVLSGDSFGLISMRERAFGSTGIVRISGRPGVGTTVHLRLPCSREDASEGVET